MAAGEMREPGPKGTRRDPEVGAARHGEKLKERSASSSCTLGSQK